MHILYKYCYWLLVISRWVEYDYFDLNLNNPCVTTVRFSAVKSWAYTDLQIQQLTILYSHVS